MIGKMVKLKSRKKKMEICGGSAYCEGDAMCFSFPKVNGYLSIRIFLEIDLYVYMYQHIHTDPCVK